MRKLKLNRSAPRDTELVVSPNRPGDCESFVTLVSSYDPRWNGCVAAKTSVINPAVPNQCDPLNSTSSSSCSSCQPRPSSRRMSTTRTNLVLTLVILTWMCSTTCGYTNCPTSNQICRLIRKTCHDRSTSMSSMSTAGGDNATECECVTIHEGGWEITCNDPTATTEATNKEFDSEDYMPAFNLLQPLFSVRYELGRQVKITCETGTPNFKAALFQGFGIDASVSSFTMLRCDLPPSLPLSVILYRTITKPSAGAAGGTGSFRMSTTFGDATYTVNSSIHGTTEESTHTEPIAPIKSLYLESISSMGVQQLNTMLSDLDKLEQLTLINHALNDVDDFLVEVDSLGHEEHAPNILRTRRQAINVSLADAEENVEFTTSSAMAEDRELPFDKFDVPEVTSIVTKPQISSAPIANSSTTITNSTWKPTTATTPMSAPSPTPTNHSIAVNELSIDGNASSVSNDIVANVIEKKPSIVLNSKALSFARTLPSLRILRLRKFVTHSTIPNVLWQIIDGLNNLEYLELDENAINEVPDKVLAYATSLKKLYLFRNALQQIAPNAFDSLERLEILDLSSNRLTDLPVTALKPLTGLMYLSLKNNQINTLGESSFTSNLALVSLDLSQNRQLEPLPPKLLAGLPHFSNLSLAFCNLSSVSVDLSTFLSNAPAIGTLDLKGNRLTNLTTKHLFANNYKLERLDLSSNQLVAIDQDIFNVNASRMRDLNLATNLLQTIPERVLFHCKRLRRLTLAWNQLSAINPKMFSLMGELEVLDLSHNRIHTIGTSMSDTPFGIASALETIDLSYNNLTDYHLEVYSINWSLLVRLRELRLSHNQFNGTLRIPRDVGSSQDNLLLDVSNNLFTSVDVSDLQPPESEVGGAQSLTLQASTTETVVELYSNPIECDCFLHPFLAYTRHFNMFERLSKVRRVIFRIDSTNELMCARPALFRNRPISQIHLNDLRCQVVDENYCPSECVCFYRSADRSLSIDCDNAQLKTIPRQLVLDNFRDIPLHEKREKVNDIAALVVSMRNNSIVELGALRHLFRWTRAPRFRNYSDASLSIHVLLDANKINLLEPDLVPARLSTKSRNIILRTLSLSNNSITSLPLPMLINFEAQAANESSRLHLAGNPIDCFNQPQVAPANCSIVSIKRWLSSHQRLVDDVRHIQCDAESVILAEGDEDAPVPPTNMSLSIVSLADEILCPTMASNTVLVSLSVMCILLASSLFVVSVLYYRNKQTILAFIYIHFNPVFICLSLSENDLDEDKLYDAFVSYSSSDRDVVMQLIERLEQPEDMSEANLILNTGTLSFHEGKVDQVVPESEFKTSNSLTTMGAKCFSQSDLESANDAKARYRLCIHERDWLPGNLISWNIVNSVQNSRRTILVLSEAFIKSIWFQVEFHTAYYQMLEDRMDRLIVIVRGELPPRDQLDKDLNFLLTTKTYLVWGEKWFWEKLYYSMPHKKRRPKAFGGPKATKTSSSATVANELTHLRPWTNAGQNGNKNKNGDAMRDYVDKTISNHFQLDSFSPNPLTMCESTPSTKPIRSAPKSLRNSGSTALRNETDKDAEDASVGARRRADGSYVNKSFYDETNT